MLLGFRTQSGSPLGCGFIIEFVRIRIRKNKIRAKIIVREIINLFSFMISL